MGIYQSLAAAGPAGVEVLVPAEVARVEVAQAVQVLVVVGVVHQQYTILLIPVQMLTLLLAH